MKDQEILASLAAPVSGASPRGRGSERLYFPIPQDKTGEQLVVWLSLTDERRNRK